MFILSWESFFWFSNWIFDKIRFTWSSSSETIFRDAVIYFSFLLLSLLSSIEAGFIPWRRFYIKFNYLSNSLKSKFRQMSILIWTRWISFLSLFDCFVKSVNKSRSGVYEECSSDSVVSALICDCSPVWRDCWSLILF